MQTVKRRVNRSFNLLRHGSMLALGLALSTSCARSSLKAEVPSEAEGTTTAQAGPGETIVNEVAGVRVDARVDDWGGDKKVFEYVTPVRLEITNNSGKKLRISYEDFELQAANGTTYEALPLYRIGGSVTEPVLVSEWDYTPVYQQGFLVAPYAAPFYDGDYLIYEGEFDYEPAYFETYYSYWADLEVPSAYMIQNSMPEGVVADKGKLVGWVYFQHVPDHEDLEPVYLTMSLVDAETGARIGRVRLPFSVR